jgi:hypothetical protein
MCASPQTENPNKSSTIRYRLNVVIFAVLMVGLTFWFQRHLQIYVTQVLLIGGTMTLWALWQLLQSWLKWGWDSDAKDTAKALFGRARGTEYLGFAGAVLLILWVTTSSLYFTFDGGAPGESEYRIETMSGAENFFPPLTFNASQRVAGQPFFLHLRPQEIKLRIVEPRGFLPLSKTLRRGERLDFKVPGNFERKKFHVLRLVPGVYFFTNLPEYSDYPAVFYEIKINRQGTPPAVFRDLRRQSLYVGADGDDIRWLLQKQERGKPLQSLTDLLHDEKVPPGATPQILPSLEANPAVFSTIEFAAGDRITIEISRRKSGSSKVIATRTIDLSELDEAIRPVLLEIPEEGPS